MSEATRHRRLWAAYLAAGLTRRDFAAKLGTNYHTVNRWDAGAAAISLDMLERASLLVGYSMDELCFGRRGTASAVIEPVTAVAPMLPTPPPTRPERRAKPKPLTEAEIRALFDAQGVDAATRAAFGEHAASPAGRYQTFTQAYVEAWCAAYAYACDPQQALQAAVNARAVTEAVSAGVAPVSAERLSAALRGSGSGKP
jgi:transcriptional regulator with XRE-family HTH domain